MEIPMTENEEVRTPEKLLAIGTRLITDYGKFVYIQFSDGDYGFRRMGTLTKSMKKQVRQSVVERWDA